MKNKYCCKRMKEHIKTGKYSVDKRGIYYKDLDGVRHDVNFCTWCGTKQMTKAWREAILKNSDKFYEDKGKRPNVIYNPQMTKEDVRDMMAHCFKREEELDSFIKELKFEGTYIFGMKIKMDEGKESNVVAHE